MGNLVPIDCVFELKSFGTDGHFDGTMGIPFTLRMAHGNRNNKAENKATTTRVKVEVVPVPDAQLRLQKALQLIMAAADRDDHPNSD